MTFLRWIAALLMRGPDGQLVIHDLDEIYSRHRARGMFPPRALWRYSRALVASAFSLWIAGLAGEERLRGGTLQDLRFGLRLFRKHPGPIGIAIGGLALAIGVVTAVFSIVNATLLRPYGMDDPSSVVSVAPPGAPAWVGVSYSQFLLMKDGTSLATVEASVSERARFSATRAGDGLANRPISFVTGGYLQMLGGRPALGRWLEPSDDVAGAPPVIVVSHYFWQHELHADPAVIGSTVWVNEAPVTLVGVLRPEFTGPVKGRRAMWAPFAAYDDLRMGPPITPAAAPRVEVTARLSPHAGIHALQDNLTAIAIRSNAPASGYDGVSPRRGVDVYSAASPVAGRAEGDVMMGLTLVLSVVALVLALACANTAHLLMAAAVTRAREVGVRLAMGATRGRIIKQMVRESLLIGCIAGGLGFVFAIWLVPVFGTTVGASPEVDLSPDWRALLFTVAVAFACGLGAGLSPARYGARGNLLAALQSQGSWRGGALPSRFRTSFVGFQAAVSMLLLVLAALLVRSAITVTSVDVGFDVDRLIGVSFNAPRSGFDEPGYVRAALAAVRNLPSVERASVSQYHPFGSSTNRQRVTVDGRVYQLNGSYSDAELFSTIGVRIVRGRAFTVEEAAAEAPVALISEDVARTFFAGREPLGQSLAAVPLAQNDPRRSATIVGVVADALLHRVDGERSGAIYVPLQAKRSNPPTLIIRTSNPGATARAVEDALRSVDARVEPMTRLIRDGLDSYLDGVRRIAWLIGPVAALALLLAALGVYGVTAFVVGQRTEEVGVRMAIGASSADVIRMLIKDSLRPVVVGLAVGLGLALVASQVLSREIGGISPHDPLSIGGALLILVACALAAVVMPARRAARTDPVGLLRRA